jgi:hypothetical protein
MIEEPKSSPFAYILGAVLIVGMVAIGFWVKRTPGSPASTGGGGAIVSPTPNGGVKVTTPDGAPASNVKFVALPSATPEETALLTSFVTALARAGEPPIPEKLGDLLAVLKFTPAEPLPANPTPAQLQAATTAHNDRIEGILIASSVFLTPKQLEIYRGELTRGLRQPSQPRTSP